MITVRTVAEVRASTSPPHAREGRTVALVPTMGAFHEGHLALMRRARGHADLVVVLAVREPRPVQRGGRPRRLPARRGARRRAGRPRGRRRPVRPGGRRGLPAGLRDEVTVAGLGDVLEGAQRAPGHFAGVATVVAKMLNMVAAGRRRVRRQGRPAGRGRPAARARPRHARPRSRSCRSSASPTGWRCPAATCTSTRTSARRATALHRALAAAAAAAEAGERDPVRLREPRPRPSCASTASSRSTWPSSIPTPSSPWTAVDGHVLVALAARVGATRLIDNITATSPETRFARQPAVADDPQGGLTHVQRPSHARRPQAGHPHQARRAQGARRADRHGHGVRPPERARGRGGRRGPRSRRRLRGQQRARLRRHGARDGRRAADALARRPPRPAGRRCSSATSRSAPTRRPTSRPSGPRSASSRRRAATRSSSRAAARPSSARARSSTPASR